MRVNMSKVTHNDAKLITKSISSRARPEFAPW
jgi:hypothetical protein